MTESREQHLRELETMVQSAVRDPAVMRTLLLDLLQDNASRWKPLMVAMQRALVAYMDSNEETASSACEAIGRILDRLAAEKISKQRHGLGVRLKLPALLQEQAT